MTEITLTEAQKQEIQKEIKIVKASKTGKLYFDKKFNGDDPTEIEMVKANGCGIFALVKWLDKSKDKELKSYIQRLTKMMNNDEAATLIEEIAGLRFILPCEEFQIDGMQLLRKTLDKKYRKSKERFLARKEKLIQEIAMDDPDAINMGKALQSARRKAEEIPPPPYLSFASEALKQGVMGHDNNNIKQSSKGSQYLRRFICIAYRTAKKYKNSDNIIFENIGAILNILAVKDDKQFTNKDIQGYVRRHCIK